MKLYSAITFECSESIKSLIFLENILNLTSLDFSDRKQILSLSWQWGKKGIFTPEISWRNKLIKSKVYAGDIRCTCLKPDLHTPTLSADFLNPPSKSKQNIASMQCLLRFWKICEQVTDFDPIFAWVLLGNFKDFESADKIGVCKSGLTRFCK